MSDHIPFDIQSNIMKRLPVKSLLQFRSVSKQWKSFIDNPKCIINYINNPNPQHHLLLRYNLVPTYTSIVDDNTFPRQKFPLTAPKYTLSLGSVNGLLCFYQGETKIIVLWNPSLRKSVGIVIPNVMDLKFGYTIIGFGVWPDTSDPKLVKINVVETPITNICWEVHVFTLSSRVWRSVYKGIPFKYCHLTWDQVFINGIIYWLTHNRLIISFDLKSEKFGQVCLPERICTYELRVVKVNDSLGLLDYTAEGEMWVCGVWMRKDGVNEPFTKIYTVKVEGKSVFNRVLGFRHNGEVVLELDDDDGDFLKSQMEVYEPSSGRINSVGISGGCLTFTVWSYMETLLLLDQSDTIIH